MDYESGFSLFLPTVSSDTNLSATPNSELANWDLATGPCKKMTSLSTPQFPHLQK